MGRRWLIFNFNNDFYKKVVAVDDYDLEQQALLIIGDTSWL